MNTEWNGDKEMDTFTKYAYESSREWDRYEKGMTTDVKTSERERKEGAYAQHVRIGVHHTVPYNIESLLLSATRSLLRTSNCRRENSTNILCDESPSGMEDPQFRQSQVCFTDDISNEL